MTHQGCRPGPEGQGAWTHGQNGRQRDELQQGWGREGWGVMGPGRRCPSAWGPDTGGQGWRRTDR